jgi:hypothetical protein
VSFKGLLGDTNSFFMTIASFRIKPVSLPRLQTQHNIIVGCALILLASVFMYATNLQMCNLLTASNSATFKLYRCIFKSQWCLLQTQHILIVGCALILLASVFMYGDKFATNKFSHSVKLTAIV